ncbi:MAG: hypothetical protein N3B01_06470 [Verrucomicrobiae bacterium]|nr:hypothetical protein [Verrucomicrobiae bacterium]
MRTPLLLLLLCAVLHVHAGPVRELGLFRKYNTTAALFDQTVSPGILTNGVGVFLKTTVDNAAARAEQQGRSAQSIATMRGRWLEWAVLVALKESKLVPAYWQAEFVSVPKNYNDVMLWCKEHGPVILSCKTSLRERYKQADLEAVALRQHYPQALFFIVTLDPDKRHVANVRKKIATKELLALHAIYDETNADELFALLRKLTLTEPPPGTLRSATTVR